MTTTDLREGSRTTTAEGQLVADTADMTVRNVVLSLIDLLRSDTGIAFLSKLRLPEEAFVAIVDDLRQNGLGALNKWVFVALMEDIAERIADGRVGTVAAGPFKGLKLSNEHGWDRAAKYVGTYEEELHPSFETAIERRPDTVINVGAAEGYYALGLARRLPDARMISFEVADEARALLERNAELNGLRSRLDIRGHCDPEGLRDAIGDSRRALLLVDVEGYEGDLLTLSDVPALTRCDLIVELHDHIAKVDFVELLSKGFERSHETAIVRPAGRNPHAISQIAHWSEIERWAAVCELRERPQNFFVGWSRN